MVWVLICRPPPAVIVIIMLMVHTSPGSYDWFHVSVLSDSDSCSVLGTVHSTRRISESYS